MKLNLSDSARAAETRNQRCTTHSRTASVSAGCCSDSGGSLRSLNERVERYWRYTGTLDVGNELNRDISAHAAD